MAITKTHHQAVAECIQRGIMEGEYKPGQRLKQQELARHFGCSVIPLREALHQLAAEGLVILSPQRGMRVADLNGERLQEIYEIRIRLEGWAAALAARSMTPEVARHLRELADKMECPDITASDWLTLDSAFHDSIYACAGQPLLRKVLSNLRRMAECYLRLDVAKQANYVRGRREHRRIIDACVRGNANAAERYAVAHLRRGMNGLLRYLRRYGRTFIHHHSPHPNGTRGSDGRR